MNRSIKEAFAKTVVHYFTDISNFNKKATVEYFLKGGHPKSTLYKIIKRFETTGCSDYKHLNAGRKPTVSTPQMTERMKKTFKMRTKHFFTRSSEQLNVWRTG